MDVDPRFRIEIEAHPPDDLDFVRVVCEAMASVNWVPLLPKPPRPVSERISQRIRDAYPRSWTGISGSTVHVRIIARREL